VTGFFERLAVLTFATVLVAAMVGVALALGYLVGKLLL
jgi:hypothetical protein